MLRRYLLALVIGLAIACPLALAGAVAAPRTLVYIGTQGTAIEAAWLDMSTGKLTAIGPVASIARPTWLAVQPKRPILYSVSEVGNVGDARGSVHSFTIDPLSGLLTPINSVGSEGGGPTHLSYDAKSETVFVANFGTGHVAALPVRFDGSLLPARSVQRDMGSGPKPAQASAHAHGATLDPGGNYVLTPDMGADRVFVYRFDARTKALSPAAIPWAAFPPGTGPRHLTFSRNGRFVFVVAELTSEVWSFAWDRRAGRLKPIQTLPIATTGFPGPLSSAEIEVSPDGRFLYASNRTESTIADFAISSATGRMAPVQTIASGGERPRSFGIDPSGRWMIVCNQNSDRLNVFSVDAATGKLAPTDHSLPIAGKPVAVAYVAR